MSVIYASGRRTTLPRIICPTIRSPRSSRCPRNRQWYSRSTSHRGMARPPRPSTCNLARFCLQSIPAHSKCAGDTAATPLLPDPYRSPACRLPQILCRNAQFYLDQRCLDGLRAAGDNRLKISSKCELVHTHLPRKASRWSLRCNSSCEPRASAGRPP